MKNAIIDDLYKIDGKAELVEGMIVMDSPTGLLPGYAAGEIFVSLHTYAKKGKPVTPLQTTPRSS